MVVQPLNDLWCLTNISRSFFLKLGEKHYLALQITICFVIFLFKVFGNGHFFV